MHRHSLWWSTLCYYMVKCSSVFGHSYPYPVSHLNILVDSTRTPQCLVIQMHNPVMYGQRQNPCWNSASFAPPFWVPQSMQINDMGVWLTNKLPNCIPFLVTRGSHERDKNIQDELRRYFQGWIAVLILMEIKFARYEIILRQIGFLI